MTGPAVTYHLWLKASGLVHERLAALIRELGAELSAPVFEPHVTLLSLDGNDEERHVTRTKELAGELTAFPIALTALSYTSQYFQCLFATVRPTEEVLRARARAVATFNKAESPYMPHVSLLYGIYSEERKRDIISRLEPVIRCSFESNAVYLIRADSLEPKDWHQVLAAPMRSPVTRAANREQL